MLETISRNAIVSISKIINSQ